MRSLPLLLQGAGMTVQILIAAAAISFSLGLLFGIFSCNYLKTPYLSSMLERCTFVLRAVPFYVQLLIIYFVIPDFFSFNLEPFFASVVALGICSSGYIAQIVRCGINSIPPVQWESARVLGFNSWQCLRHIILPQMFRNVLPAFNNEIDSLLKSTAIVSSIGMLELTRMGMNIISREMQPVTIYLTIAFFYVCMSNFLNFVFKRIERKYVKN